MVTSLSNQLAHVLGLLVNDDRDGIAEIVETAPEQLHALRAAGLAIWRHDGWHPTQAGRDAWSSCTTYRIAGVHAPTGVGLAMGAALSRQQGRNRT